MSPPVHLVSLSTALPPHEILQTDAAQAAATQFADRFKDFGRLVRVFETAGIRKRHAVRPLEWYAADLGWPERTAAYLEGAQNLFVEAATKALDAAGITAAEVDSVVTVSSTGIATPSLEARASARMGFRADIERVPVFGLGCAGGVSGLGIASRLAKARPGAVVLLVVIEICTLSFRHDVLSSANIVATALFGDGAAACVLRTGESGMARVEHAAQHTWPDTLDIMGWSVDPQGLGVIFDRAIPPFAEANLAAAVTSMLASGGLTMADVDRFVCHPGGVKVIQALERSLDLGQGALDHERDVLRDFGNMSAPTALFVLDRVANDGLPDRSVVTAMGPGFSASCVSLRRAA